MEQIHKTFPCGISGWPPWRRPGENPAGLRDDRAGRGQTGRDHLHRSQHRHERQKLSIFISISPQLSHQTFNRFPWCVSAAGDPRQINPEHEDGAGGSSEETVHGGHPFLRAGSERQELQPHGKPNESCSTKYLQHAQLLLTAVSFFTQIIPQDGRNTEISSLNSYRSFFKSSNLNHFHLVV